MHLFQTPILDLVWNVGTGAAFRLRAAISAAFLSDGDGVSQSHWKCDSPADQVLQKAMEIHCRFPKCSTFLMDVPYLSWETCRLGT